nr:MAG TPA: hypothetical protein [Caudoviricetes sp.]
MTAYIDKDALLHKLRERHDKFARIFGDCDNYVMGLDDAIELLKNASAADVQKVKHGKWIYQGHHEMMGHAFQCSVCERWMFTNFPKHVVEEYHYCHCGARMDSVEGLEDEE